MISFRRVVIDNVENYLQSSRMKGLDHCLKLANGVSRQVTRLQCKKSNRIIAPIVAESTIHQSPIIHETVDRHKLDRRNAQACQIVDHGSRRQARICSAQASRNIGMAHGEALYVKLVDQRFVPWNIWGCVRAPGKGGVNYFVLRHTGGIVTPVERQIFLLASDTVSKV